jgi:5'-nucleotidase
MVPIQTDGITTGWHRLTIALCLLGVSLMPRAEPANPVEVSLVHVNDVYQTAPIDPKVARGGLARLMTLVTSIRRTHPATLFLFGGDTLSPSVESGLFKGRQMIAAWNALRVDLAVPGNHEFDFGPAILRERLTESRFTWLAANIQASPPLPNTAPSVLREINGVRVGLIGLITPETGKLSDPGPDIRFANLLTTAKREAAALRRLGAESLIGLTHCSMEEDRALAATGLFDVILGGHDHHIVGEQVGRTLIFKAGADARDLIHLRMRFAQGPEGHQLAGTAWQFIPVDDRWTEDSEVVRQLAVFDNQTDQLLNQPLATTSVPLDARGATLRRGESNIGNFAADAIRQAMQADISILNAGGFRSDRILGPGTLTRRDIQTLLPFQNKLVLLSISGAQLHSVLEYSLDKRVTTGQSNAFLQISGMGFTYAPHLPKGERIQSLLIAGKPVQPARQYTLATSAYLARGGDGYALLKTLPVLREPTDTPTETEVVSRAMECAGRLAPTIEGRIQSL